MYVERSLRGYPKKENLVDELNFKMFMRLKRKTTIKFYVGIIYKIRKFIINTEYFDSKNIFSYPFIQNIKHKQNMVQDM